MVNFFPQYLNKSLSLLFECVSVLRQLSETAEQTRTVRPAPRALCVLFAKSAVRAIIKREHHHAECCMAQCVRACVRVCVCVCLSLFLSACPDACVQHVCRHITVPPSPSSSSSSSSSLC